MKIPVSISELNYRDHDLFIALMVFVITFTLAKGYYVSSLFFAGVYVFRFFHMTRQRYFHYAFAMLAFGAVAYQAWIFWPIVLGSLLFLINKVKKTTKEVFWFEMGAGIPYLLLI